MRILFHIHRHNYFRILAPIIEECLRRGHEALCLYSAEKSADSLKGCSLITPDSFSCFSADSGRLLVESYNNKDSFHALLKENARSGPLCGIAALPYEGQRILDAAGGTFVYVQYTVEIVGPLLSSESADLFTPKLWMAQSAYWKEYLRAAFREGALSANRDIDAFIEATFCEVGAPQFDVLNSLSVEPVRRQFNIPDGKRIVLLGGFPYESNPKTTWSLAFTSHSSLHRLARAVRYMNPKLFKRPKVTDREFCRNLKAFCDANNAVLIVKARRKDSVPSYLQSLSHRVVYDDELGTAAILELMIAADLAISFTSCIVFEAVRCGVPHLCVDLLCDSELLEAIPLLRHVWGVGGEETFHDFSGATKRLEAAEAIEYLKRVKLAEQDWFHKSRQAEYVRKHLGTSDCMSGARVLDVLETMGR